MTLGPKKIIDAVPVCIVPSSIISFSFLFSFSWHLLRATERNLKRKGSDNL